MIVSELRVVHVAAPHELLVEGEGMVQRKRRVAGLTIHEVQIFA